MMGAGPRWKDRGGVQGKLSSAHPGVAGQESKGEEGVGSDGQGGRMMASNQTISLLPTGP